MLNGSSTLSGEQSSVSRESMTVLHPLQFSGVAMPLFLILIAIVTLLAVLILYGDRSPHRSERDPQVSSSISLLTEPGRPPLPHEWKYKYIPIAKTTLATRDGKTWIHHREDVPLFKSSSGTEPHDLRQHRIIFN